MKEDMRVGDWGTELKYLIKNKNEPVPLDGAVLLTLKLEKPNGNVIKRTATAVSSYYVRYVTVPGDIDIAGWWSVSSYIVLGSGAWNSTHGTFQVKETL